MLFSSMIFIWVFLPVALIGSRILMKVNIMLCNIFLLVMSILFYAWGEPVYILLMLCSILLNYLAGRLLGIANDRECEWGRRLTLIGAIAANLMLLGYFKYYDFVLDSINHVVGKQVFGLKTIALPIGISFFTFQALSYVIDLYRREYPVQKSLINLALYISFFPQLVAGPIVKYYEINTQLTNRQITPEKTAEGIRRFIYGLAKKVLIANLVSAFVDQIYAKDLSQVNSAFAWIAAIGYMIQIYYDFSGYSDMAIGMGKMFGFDFLENFRLPYLSTSAQEFWQRWHISLGSWFREYLYIPLGGNRKGLPRTLINTLIVFILTGAWHGASWNFVLWGLYYGILLVIERLWLGKFLRMKKLAIFAHLYTILAVLFGWVLFRADTIHQAGAFIKRMLMPWKYPTTVLNFWEVSRHVGIAALVVGIIFCGPAQLLMARFPKIQALKYGVLESIYCGFLLLLCLSALVANTYNPFIYFRF